MRRRRRMGRKQELIEPTHTHIDTINESKPRGQSLEYVDKRNKKREVGSSGSSRWRQNAKLAQDEYNLVVRRRARLEWKWRVPSTKNQSTTTQFSTTHNVRKFEKKERTLLTQTYHIHWPTDSFIYNDNTIKLIRPENEVRHNCVLLWV